MIVWVITLHFLVNCLNFFTWKGCYHLPSFLANSNFSSILFLKMMGGHLGSMGLYCMAFLFLPVARGSVLLRFINIPFEHATRYHVWLGHLTMVLFTLHGLLYIVGWAMEGNLLHKVSPHASLFSFFLPAHSCLNTCLATCMSSFDFMDSLVSWWSHIWTISSNFEW